MQWLKLFERNENRLPTQTKQKQSEKQRHTAGEIDQTFWGMSPHDALAVNIVTREVGQKI